MSSRNTQRAVIALIAPFIIIGCETKNVGEATPTINITANPTSISIPRGSSGSVTITVARTGAVVDVTLTSSGAPTGVTVAPVFVAIGATTGTVTIAAQPNAPLGMFELTIEANAPGADGDGVEIAVTIVEATSTFTMTAAPPAVTVVQGASTTTEVTIARTGPVGTVTFTAPTPPTGLSVTFNPTSATGNTTIATISATAGAPVGGAQVTIRGTSSASTTNLMVPVTVQAPASLLAFDECSGFGPILWLAYQENGTGPFVPVTPSGGTYTVSASAAKGVLAVASPRFSGFRINVVAATKEELAAMAAATCPPTDPPRTANGMVTGLVVGDLVSVGTGTRVNNFVAAATTAQYTATEIPAGPVGQIATRSNAGIVSRILVRINQNPPDGGTFTPIDLATGGAPPVTTQFTFGNTMGEMFGLTSQFLIPGGTPLSYFTSPDVSTSATRTFFGVSETFRFSGLHVVQAAASGASSSRTVQSVFGAAVNKMLNFGATPGAVTVSSASATGLVQPRFQYGRQSDYDRWFMVTASQGAGTAQRSLVMQWSSGYLGSANIDDTMPNFSIVPGFETTWGFARAVLTSWTFVMSGWNLTTGIGTAPFEDGSESRTALRSGTFTF